MLKSYLVIALRNIRKNKVHSAINVFCLALGMACCVLMMFWIKNDLETDRFHANLDRLFRVETVENLNGQRRYIDRKTSFPVAQALRTEFPEVESSARILKRGRKIFQHENKVFWETGLAFVDPSFFDLFTFRFIQGDPATAFTLPHRIILTQSMARKYFGDGNPVGKSISIDHKFEVTVAAVIEDIPGNTHFNRLYSTNCFVPLDLQKEYGEPMTGWDESYLWTYVMLNRGADHRQFNDKIIGYLGDKHPRMKKHGYGLMLHPVKHIHLYGINGGKTGMNSILIYTAFAFIILLIACINYINLATAFSLRRAKEIGIRKVLGTDRKNIIVQFLWESVVLCLLALVLALALVTHAFPFFRSMVGDGLEITSAGVVQMLPLILAMTLVAALISGIFPAFFLSSLKPITVLKGRNAGGESNLSLRKVLITVQILIATIFIIGTLTIFSQFKFLTHTDIGHDNRNIICINRGTSDRGKFYAFKSDIQNHHGIKNLGAGGIVPGYSTNFAFRDIKYQGVPLDNSPLFHGLFVDYGYFETLQIPMIEGKDFSPDVNSTQGVIINRMAAALLGGADVIGNTLEFDNHSFHILGIVDNFPVWSLKFTMYPIVAVYDPDRSPFVYVKLDEFQETHTDTIGFVRTKWKEYFPEYPFEYRYLADLDQNLYQQETALLKIFVSLAMLAILICCLGIYGMVSFFIQGRLRDIGIRKILGADLKHLVANISRGLLRSLLVANILAIPIAWILLNRWLQSYAFRIDLGAAFFIAGSLLSIVFGLAPISPHIRRVYKLNPVNLLREE